MTILMSDQVRGNKKWWKKNFGTSDVLLGQLKDILGGREKDVHSKVVSYGQGTSGAPCVQVLARDHRDEFIPGTKRTFGEDEVTKAARYMLRLSSSYEEILSAHIHGLYGGVDGKKKEDTKKRNNKCADLV
jgi:hypothetical protein